MGSSPYFTLSAHRRAMRVLAAAAVVIVASEVIGVGAALTRPSTLTGATEEFAELVAIAAAAAVLRYLYRAELEEISLLRRSANVDGLTGLGSRSFFERAARRRVEQAVEIGTPLSCVLLDVDDFKAHNDNHGHDAGDEILRCVARIMRESARADDFRSSRQARRSCSTDAATGELPSPLPLRGPRPTSLRGRS